MKTTDYTNCTDYTIARIIDYEFYELYEDNGLHGLHGLVLLSFFHNFGSAELTMHSAMQNEKLWFFFCIALVFP